MKKISMQGLALVALAGSVCSVASGQDRLGRPAANSPIELTPSYMEYRGVRYPVTAPVRDDVQLLYENGAAPYPGVFGLNFSTGSAPRQHFMDQVSFNPGPGGGAGRSFTSMKFAIFTNTPAVLTDPMDVLIKFWDTVNTAASPVTSNQIGAQIRFAFAPPAGGWVVNTPYISTEIDITALGLASADDQIYVDQAYVLTGGEYPANTNVGFTGRFYSSLGAGQTVGSSGSSYFRDVSGDGNFTADEERSFAAPAAASFVFFLKGEAPLLGPGACCFPDGSCTSVNAVQCATALPAAGIYHGLGTECGVLPNGVCPQPGACCLADGSCTGVQPIACSARTGVFRGEGILCGTITCPQPFDYETAHGDAGELRPTAPIAIGAGPLPGIVGGSIGTEDVDMYDIFICDPANFRASTVTWTSPLMDSMLFLFKESGIGVVIDDDSPGNGVESTLTNVGITAPGRYYLAISGWDRGPVGVAGDPLTRIWATQSVQNTAPNGPGAAMPVAGWLNFGTTPATGNPAATGFYTIAFHGACYVDHPCYANCDSSTITPCLNVQDFGCFLNKFAGGDSYANCDNSTIAPVLNVQDFGCFLNRFAAGCSNC